MSDTRSKRASRFGRGAMVVGLLCSAVGFATSSGASAVDTSVPVTTTTAAASPVAPPVTVADSSRRLGGGAATFQPTPRPALNNSRVLAVEALPRLAASALDALSGRPAPAPYADLRSRLAAAVAARLTTATAAELDAAWAATTVVRMTVVLSALAQVGKPYAYAVAGPNAFDCSGLVLFAWQSVGVSLKHQSEEQINQVLNVAATQARAGDIAWYPNHVAIVLGAGHAIVHAQQPGVPLGISDWSDRTSRFGSPLP